MTIQVLLTLGVAGVLLYALAHRRKAPALAALISTGSLLGCFLVWAPELSNRVANAVGVGRGADLIFYLWIVISAAIMVNLHIKLRATNADLATLVREIALATPDFSGKDATAVPQAAEPSSPTTEQDRL